ncbi:MAG: fibronectin type III domain-containing protein [Planctomycetota bacterium]
MRTVPVTNAAKISFFETHLPVWEPEPETIGLTPDQVDELAALTAEARDAFNDARAAREAAQAATLRQTQAVIRMAAFGGSLIKTIRAFAETTDNPGVFSQAQLPAPKGGAPLGPAPTPINLTATLTNDGAIALRWDAETAGRMGFIIERRTAKPGRASGPWALVGTSTAKRFNDDRVPAGLASLQYRVTAERPGGRSQPTEPLVVLFGSRSEASDNRMQIAA